MRLAARIGKLEKVIRPAEPGCGKCRGHLVMMDSDVRRDGGRLSCGACGNVFTRRVKVIVGIDWGAL